MKRDQMYARLLAFLIVAVGLLNIYSALAPALPERLKLLREIMPLVMVHGSRHLVILVGLLLILIARAIMRRKKLAWWVTFLLILASAVLHLLKGLDFEEAAFACLIVVLMIRLYPLFQAGVDRPNFRNALSILLGILFLNIAYGVLGFYILDRQFNIISSWAGYLGQTLQVMFGTGIPEYKMTWHISWFLNSLWLTWEIGLIGAVIMLIRPIYYQRDIWPHEQEKARLLAKKYGRSSLVYFTLWKDKSYFFNQQQNAYISFVQIQDAVVALGDPIGEEAALSTIVEEFLAFCYRNGWHPSFYQVLPDNLALYHRVGLQSLHIGDEAIVDLNEFSLNGKKFKHLRNTFNRLQREGYRAVWYTAPLPDELIPKLKAVSDDWLAYQGGDEKAFSLGWFDAQALRENRVLTIEDEQHQIYAFTNFVPMYTLSQESPDMMRYCRNAPPGTMDFLFLESMLYFKEHGIEGFNLGLAPLSHVGEEDFSTATEKAVHFLWENFYNFKGLYAFKTKFSPRWEPRFLIYPDLVTLPLVVMAIVRAGNPAGVAKFWRWMEIRLRKHLKNTVNSPLA